MKKNKKNSDKEDPEVLLNAKKLSNLLLEKIETIQYLNDLLYTHNKLSVKPEEAEEWVFGLPAKNITQLNDAGKGVLRTCLQDLKERDFYKKEYRLTQEKATSLDIQIRMAKIDLLISKVDNICQKK